MNDLFFSCPLVLQDYKGDQQCYGGDYSCFPSIGEAFLAANPDTTTVVPGVDMDSQNASGIPAALAAAAAAEQVCRPPCFLNLDSWEQGNLCNFCAVQVLIFVGIGNTQEHEGIDRFNTSLPGLQEPFTLQVLEQCRKQGIPAAVVLINGIVTMTSVSLTFFCYSAADSENCCFFFLFF